MSIDVIDGRRIIAFTMPYEGQLSVEVAGRLMELERAGIWMSRVTHIPRGTAVVYRISLVQEVDVVSSKPVKRMETKRRTGACAGGYENRGAISRTTTSTSGHLAAPAIEWLCQINNDLWGRCTTAEKRASSFDPTIYLDEPGKIGAGYRLVIISKRPSFGTLLGLSAITMTDKIFNLLFVPIFTSAVRIISSTILKESIWLLHVTGGSFVLNSILIIVMIAN
ncbi:hypothetical protein ALC60_07213 [Trachymyrmex zeteki]|uniref:Uncharacterized protein n=1 Tax=Mycetomoellerius zeteki TaxID=64791 RepID=A0A151X0T3_9HYME|nr:hypothetical protein ALC60_07213 [Trachymyrmex zeteki]